jgi:carboxyl-terminal processing protease
MLGANVAALLLAFAFPAAGAPLDVPPASDARVRARANAEDLDALWRAIDEGYAYFDGGRPAWRRVREVWRPRAAKAATRAQLVAALEGAIARLHDDHVSLSESTPDSPRAVPGQTDVWAGWKGGAAVIEAVRTYSDADVAGLRPGQVVTKIDGVPVERAVRDVLGRGAATGPAERGWALRHALAGPRTGGLKLEVMERNARRSLEVEHSGARAPNGVPLAGRRIGEERDLGYIRVRTRLSEPGLADAFDRALDSVKDTRALILDLREVGAGGSRETVASIIARFVDAPAPWQVREARNGARTVDRVAPRGAPYRGALVVLVDRWTAGEGEALAAGLFAAAKARIVGTAMAGLHGELAEIRLPHSGILARFPAQKTFLPDGTPRESIAPSVLVDLSAPQGGPGDPILYQALKLLERR